MLAYKRIIVKLSGETFLPTDRDGCVDQNRVLRTAQALGNLRALGAEIGVVMGGGNIWRGRITKRMNPVNADQMGMLATVINALCLEDALRGLDIPAAVFTAQPMERFAAYYTARSAGKCLKEGGVALLAGGTGHPFFTTDTTAVLRAAELKADAVFKGTNVEGVFDKDPNRFKDAVLIRRISYAEAAARGLRAMDLTAFQLCVEARIPVVRVFSMDDVENIVRVSRGDEMGTTLYSCEKA